MEVSLTTAGRAILDDEWLCPRVSRDDLGAGTETLYQLGELLSSAKQTITLPEKPTYRSMAHAIRMITPTFPPRDQELLNRGVRELVDAANKRVGHPLSLTLA
jgi:hypothetical protein